MPLTTPQQVRAAFWAAAPQLAQQCKHDVPRQYRADVCYAFCTFIDQCEQAGVISRELAERASL